MKENRIPVRCYKKRMLKRHGKTFPFFLKCCIISLMKKMKLSGRNYGGLSYFSGGR